MSFSELLFEISGDSRLKMSRTSSIIELEEGEEYKVNCISRSNPEAEVLIQNESTFEYLKSGKRYKASRNFEPQIITCEYNGTYQQQILDVHCEYTIVLPYI